MITRLSHVTIFVRNQDEALKFYTEILGFEKRMDAKLGDLQQQLEKLGNETRTDDRDASRQLDEAAGSIRDKRIREKIRYSKGTLNGQPSEYARAMEADMGEPPSRTSSMASNNFFGDRRFNK